MIKNKRKAIIISSVIVLGALVGLYFWIKRDKPENTLGGESQEENSGKESAEKTIKEQEKSVEPKKEPKKETTEPKKELPLSFPKDTILVPRAPLRSASALDKTLKKIGNFSKATYVSDLGDKYIIAKVNKPKGAYFEIVTVYLLKKDWGKA
jgi:hypothetical protein